MGCRSDAGLSAPIIRRLKEAKWCECTTYQLDPKHFFDNILDFGVYLSLNKPDLVLCVGDRVEMASAAYIVYNKQIPIGHVYAGAMGDTSEKVTLDDINRFAISLYADICFCEDEAATNRVHDLWAIIGKARGITLDLNIHEVGITHMDDLEVDEELVPPEPYDLVLVNPTLKKERIEPIISGNVIILRPNPDKGFLVSQSLNVYTDASHSQFLGLLKNCQRFITNSSSGYYEAPFFLKEEQIIWVGQRNSARREYKRLEMGASEKIVKILKDYNKNKKEVKK